LPITPVADATHVNLPHVPAHMTAAGYTTGPPDIRWSDADWQAHPGAVRICQDASASDATADVLDVERFAATNGEAAGWFRRASAAYTTAVRPGQRWPAFYTSALNVTPLVNALIAGGVRGGPGLWVADWNLTGPQAIADVQAGSGPFPVVGVQWTDSPVFYDLDVMSAAWLAKVSGPASGYSHLTGGTESLGTLAAARNMGIFQWLAEQEHMHPDDAANLVASAVPPEGMRWWSTHPG
jgi:hypothetical protein